MIVVFIFALLCGSLLPSEACVPGNMFGPLISTLLNANGTFLISGKFGSPAGPFSGPPSGPFPGPPAPPAPPGGQWPYPGSTTPYPYPPEETTWDSTSGISGTSGIFGLYDEE